MALNAGLPVTTAVVSLAARFSFNVTATQLAAVVSPVRGL
jgi:hypothetical protein